MGSIDLAAELSQRERTVRSHYDFGGGFISDATYNSHQTQFSPRLRYVAHPYGLLNEVVTGIDLIRWTRDTTSSFSLADARQVSKAIYLRDELRFDAAHDGRLAIGVRHETFDKDYADTLGFAAPESRTQSQNAWDMLQVGTGAHMRHDVHLRIDLKALAARRIEIGIGAKADGRVKENFIREAMAEHARRQLALRRTQRQAQFQVVRHLALENIVRCAVAVFIDVRHAIALAGLGMHPTCGSSL